MHQQNNGEELAMMYDARNSRETNRRGFKKALKLGDTNRHFLRTCDNKNKDNFHSRVRRRLFDEGDTIRKEIVVTPPRIIKISNFDDNLYGRVEENQHSIDKRSLIDLSENKENDNPQSSQINNGNNLPMKYRTFRELTHLNIQDISPVKPLPATKNHKEHVKIDQVPKLFELIDMDQNNTDLTGDYSSKCSLPLVENSENELRIISHETLRDLLEGVYSGSIENYSIIDCRFPYEYEGGHIINARNIYTRESLLSGFFPVDKAKRSIHGSCKKHVLIFHCEFSQERAPKMMRFVRNTDREMNKENFPNLFYPDIYLLRGGYESFHANQLQHCTPKGYILMSKHHLAEMSRYKSEITANTRNFKF